MKKMIMSAGRRKKEKKKRREMIILKLEPKPDDRGKIVMRERDRQEVKDIANTISCSQKDRKKRWKYSYKRAGNGERQRARYNRKTRKHRHRHKDIASQYVQWKTQADTQKDRDMNDSERGGDRVHERHDRRTQEE